MRRRRYVAGLGESATDSAVKSAANTGCAALVAAGGGPGLVCAAIVNIDVIADATAKVLDTLGLAAKGEYDYLTVPEAMGKNADQLLQRTFRELSESYQAARTKAGLPPPTSVATLADIVLKKELKRQIPPYVERRTGQGRVIYLDATKGLWFSGWKGWPQPPDDDDVKLYAAEWDALFTGSRLIPIQTATEIATKQLDDIIRSEVSLQKAEQREKLVKQVAELAAKQAAERAAELAAKQAADRAAKQTQAVQARAEAQAASKRNTVFAVGLAAVGLVVGGWYATRSKRKS